MCHNAQPTLCGINFIVFSSILMVYFVTIICTTGTSINKNVQFAVRICEEKKHNYVFIKQEGVFVPNSILFYFIYILEDDL